MSSSVTQTDGVVEMVGSIERWRLQPGVRPECSPCNWSGKFQTRAALADNELHIHLNDGPHHAVMNAEYEAGKKSNGRRG